MKAFSLVFILALVISTFQGSATTNQSYSSADKITLTAAGATFPMPFYNLLFKMYDEKTGVVTTYGGIGSGGGIKSLTDKVVDFGATDGFLSDKAMQGMPATIVHMPTCMGAVVIAYNLPGVNNIKLSNDLLVKIFMGQITKWNDPQLVKNNPGIKFPNTNITVVHRSDGSGTTEIFSDYLSKVSKTWEEKVGAGKSLEWPIGLGAKGNPGVAGTISQTAGALGYVGSEYAFAQKIQMAELQNAAGKYIQPTIASVSAAAKGEIPADTRVMLTNSSAPDAYPICGFTWLILYKEQNYNGRTLAQVEATLKLLDWMISPEAQSQAEKVNYAPLPKIAVEKAKVILRSITFNGKQILK